MQEHLDSGKNCRPQRLVVEPKDGGVTTITPLSLRIIGNDGWLMVQHTSTTDINLAVYMERLDAYIASQTALNNTLVEGLERVHTQITEFNYWRNRMYGAKTIVIALGVLIVHTSAVMGGFLALANFINR